jgi:hypothetical protein
VFEVYAEFPPGEGGPYPLPYFAKIDSAVRILKEYEAYERFVTHYIPFNQRPNLEPKRCLLGLTDGILVGDFVDESVALADVIRPTGARSIIHSLFDDALHGWRLQSFAGDERIPWDKIRSDVVHTNNIKSAYVDLARTFGAQMSPKQLVARLDASNKYAYRRGPLHGDLTTQNIRVRNGEAVLIDFYQSKSGPVVSDLASLEIAVCFLVEADTPWNSEANGPYSGSPRFSDWRSNIDSLFLLGKGQFGRIPPNRKQPSPYNWMWSVCRQLRLMAHYIEPDESAYKYMLAAQMLRMTTFPEDERTIVAGSTKTVVGGYCYLTAERVVLA